MPVHDWARADGDVFHMLHTMWLAHLTDAINATLPAGYYAMPERKVDVYVPDVSTFTEVGPAGPAGRGGVAVAEPRAERRVALRVPAVPSRRLAVRAAKDKRVVAVLELVSPWNKDRPEAVDDFAGKVADFVRNGVHEVVIDVLPPGPHDPGGPHPEVCARLDPDGPPGDPPPPGRPLTVASYRADHDPAAFFGYAAAGDALPDATLCLDGGVFVSVPLEQVYRACLGRFPAQVLAELG